MDAGLIYIQHILFGIKQSGLICARYGAVGVDGIKGGFVSSGACTKVLETGYRRSPPLQPLHLPRTLVRQRRSFRDNLASVSVNAAIWTGKRKPGLFLFRSRMQQGGSSSFWLQANRPPTRNWSSPGTSPRWLRRGEAACMFALLVHACRALPSSWNSRG